MGDTKLIGDKIGSVGNLVGARALADFFIDWPTGLCLQDSNKNWWRITVDTDGTLITTPISI